jgi:anti-sigma factor RsiW
MVDHAEMTLMMSLALDGMLGSEERGEFEAHLVGCAICQAEWERWQRVDALLATEPERSPSPELVAGVLRRLSQRGRRQSRLVGGALLVGGSLSVWGMVVLALSMSAALWFLSDPVIAVHVAHVGSQLLAAVGLLATAVRLGLGGLVRPTVWPWLAVFACMVLMLTSLWMRVVQRRPLRPMGPMLLL